MIFRSCAQLAEQTLRVGMCAAVGGADYISRSARAYSEQGEALVSAMATMFNPASTNPTSTNPTSINPTSPNQSPWSEFAQCAATQYLRALSDLAVAPMASASLFDGLVGQTEEDRTNADQWPAPVYRVGERPIALPVRFWASQGIAMYSVDANIAARFVPEFFKCYQMNSRAVVALRITDYLSSDLGPYFEIDMAFGVEDRAGSWPVPGTYALQMLVTSEFARDTGHLIWGYPKIVAPLEIVYRGAQDAQCNVLNERGDLSIQVSMSRGPRTQASSQVPVFSYTDKNNTGFRTRIVRSGKRESLVLDQNTVQVQVYDEQYLLGRAIKALDLPNKRPLFHLWTDEMSATLEHPYALLTPSDSAREPAQLPRTRAI